MTHDKAALEKIKSKGYVKKREDMCMSSEKFRSLTLGKSQYSWVEKVIIRYLFHERISQNVYKREKWIDNISVSTRYKTA